MHAHIHHEWALARRCHPMTGRGRRHGMRHAWGAGGPPHHRGPRARRGDVRAALLLLLAEEPRNGYGLMQEIEERSGGAWRPSPGSVYPALAQLEDEGLVRTVEHDGGRAFEITDAGREHLARRGEDAPAPWDAAREGAGQVPRELMQLVRQVGIAAAQVIQAGDDAQVEQAREVLKDARRRLYRILAEDPADEPEG